MEKETDINYQKNKYRLGRLLCNSLGLFCLNPKIYGKENIPKESAILIANHATNLDGLLISMFTKKQIHFWIQYEDVFEKNAELLYSIGEIPVKTKSIDRKFWKEETLGRSIFLLYHTDNIIGIFPEGPMESLDKNGNKAYRGAVNLACRYHEAYKKKKKIVPVGLWTPDKYKKRLEKYKSGFNLEKMLMFVKENSFRRVPYYVIIGEGIEISNCNAKEQKELAQYVVEKCNDLVEIIKEN